MNHNKRILHYAIAMLVVTGQAFNLYAQNIQISEVAVPFTNTTISGLAQDINGNIWIASNNQGLYRYNGDDYKLYSHQRDNPNSLISDRLECIYAAKSGHIWIGSFANGLSRLDPATDSFTNFTQSNDDPASIRSNAIRRITEDNEGRIWVATLKGLDYYDPAMDTFKRDFEESEAAATLSKAHIRTLYLDSAGILWAGASSPFFGEQSDGGLYRIDPKERSVKRYLSSDDTNSLNSDIVTAIFEDSRGVFWVGTAEDGLHTMDRELGRFQRHLNVPGNPNQLSRPPVKGFSYALDHIRFIEEDGSGKIWIGSMNNGINVFDPNEGTIIHLNDTREDQYGLPVNDFWSALKTKDELLWLGAWSPGDSGAKLIKVNLSPVELGFVDVGGPVYSFVDAERGSIYIGSEQAIGRINPRDELTNYYIFSKEGIERVAHLSRSEDKIWACTEKGLLYYNPTFNQHQLYPLYDEELAVGELLELNSAALLSPDSVLVASSNGLFLFDHKTEEFTPINFRPDYLSERTSATVNLVYIDREKRIWVGFDIYGLYLLQSDLQTFKDYRFLPNVQDGPEVIKEDKYNTLYVGNWRSGLQVYNAEQDTFFQLTDQNDLLKADSRITNILFTSDSTLWLGANMGALNYNLNSQTSAIIEFKEFEEYEITSQPFTAQNGFSYIGSSYGYIKFKPEDFEVRRGSDALPSISKVFLGEQNITPQFKNDQEVVALNYNQNDVSFTLSYIDFISGIREKQLEYKLKGYDQKWRKGKNDEEVYYYKLPPGGYAFQLRKLAANGKWKEDKKPFRILAPWWQTWWAYLLYALALGIGIWLFTKFQKERTIRKEREKTRERELAQAKAIEKAYDELKATQAQLIQSEKMASLGELTAGIAHEIQNPLNFVNNFSKVSNELLEEMEEEIEAGNEEEIREVMGLLSQNLSKITHHGERASSIVKGMLQHSRTSKGEKEWTDLNALCDEYLRLAYHGVRAKDKNFNVSTETSFDESLRKIELVPQDFGRVVVNLITNAFYAVTERKQKEDENFKPVVTVRTRKENEHVIVEVQDNGIGIPKDKIEKIFQPFFTTKPTGQGTGLGLSLSYDIVKANGGTLKVRSEEGKGSKFIVNLPILSNLK